MRPHICFFHEKMLMEEESGVLKMAVVDKRKGKTKESSFDEDKGK